MQFTAFTSLVLFSSHVDLDPLALASSFLKGVFLLLSLIPPPTVYLCPVARGIFLKGKPEKSPVYLYTLEMQYKL